MHESVFVWVGQRVQALGLQALKPILEVGSYNVNGSVRLHFDAESYTGVDVIPGPGVDRVVSSTKLPFEDATFALVVSTEMLEHAEHPVPVLQEMFRVLRAGGVMLLTTRSEGFPYHNPPDYHRFSESDIRALTEDAGFGHVTVEQDPQPNHPGVFVVAHKGVG